MSVHSSKQLLEPDVRMRIILAAKMRFAQVGFEGASVSQISQKAGVTKSLLHYYFQTKLALWKAVLDYCFEQAQSYQPRSRLDDPLEQFLDQTLAFIRYCEQDSDLHRIMTIESSSGGERLSWLVDAHLKPRFNGSKHLIEQAQKRGMIREGQTAIILYSIVALSGTLYSLYPEISRVDPSSKRASPQEILDLIKAMILIGEAPQS